MHKTNDGGNEPQETQTGRPPRFPKLDRPWLVAAWPGMGSVASLAGGHLVSALAAEPAGMIPEREVFPVNHVEVKAGIARSGRLPRSMFFSRHDPDGIRDVLLFLAEAQPERGGYRLCNRILDLAIQHGVERVVTFAALGTALHPKAEPRVLGAVTDPALLDELDRAGIERLAAGQVSGLNGALLAAAAERGIPAMCLLGEFPFFAAAAPNPKSALAVLRGFQRLSGLHVEFDELERMSAQVEPQLLGLLEQLQGKARGEGGIDGLPEDPAFDAADEEPADADHVEPQAEVDPLAAVDPAALARVERLFADAERDRTATGALKAELDRLGVFSVYEDRFLDLFRSHG